MGSLNTTGTIQIPVHWRLLVKLIYDSWPLPDGKTLNGPDTGSDRCFIDGVVDAIVGETTLDYEDYIRIANLLLTANAYDCLISEGFRPLEGIDRDDAKHLERAGFLELERGSRSTEGTYGITKASIDLVRKCYTTPPGGVIDEIVVPRGDNPTI